MTTPASQLPLTIKQKQRYQDDADFHARVDVVSRAIWGEQYLSMASTKESLLAYAIAAVEAIEEHEDGLIPLRYMSPDVPED